MLLVMLIVLETTLAIDKKPIYRGFDDHNNSVAQCLHLIAKEHNVLLYKPTTVNNIPLSDEKKTSVDVLQSTFIKTLAKNLIPVSISMNLNERKESDLIIFVLIQNCALVLETDIKDTEDYRILIVIKQNFEECKEIIRKTSKNFKATDVTFVVRDTDNTFVFVTMKPEINELTCEVTKHLIKINHCINGLLAKNNLKHIFPSKTLTNFKKCPIKIGLATMFPFSMIKNEENSTNLDPVYEANGSDVEIIKIITEKVNASLNFHFIYTTEENIYLHIEYLDFLLNGTLDACAGGLYRIHGNLVEYSGIYSRQSLVWVYYAEREIRSWQSLVRKINGLYYFLFFYICSTLVWRLLSVFDRQSVTLENVFLYGWGALLGANSLPNAKSLKKRFLGVVYFIMSTHLSAYISIQMYSYLTIQEQPQIYKTVHDFEDSKRTVYFSKKYFIQDKNEVTSKECNDFNDCLKSVLKFKGSTLSMDSNLIPFQAFSAVDDEARLLSVPQSVLVVYHEMIIRKNHPLVQNYKIIIKRLFEAGICQKLYNDAIGITNVHKSEIVKKNIMSDGYSCISGCAITLAQAAGVFYVWIFVMYFFH